MKKIQILLATLFCTALTSFAQTIGPAGIGTSDGSVGPRNVLWLRADAGVTETGTVSAWADQTANGLNAIQATLGLQPSFNAANPAFNGLPSMNFLPGAAANYHLAVPDNDLLDNSPGMSFFIVLNPAVNGTLGILNKRTDAGVNQSYRLYRLGGNILSNISNGANATIAMGNSANIFSSIYDQTLSGNKYNTFVNSTSNASSNVTTTLPNRNSPLYIGNFDLTDTRSFNGDIAEIIIYNDALNGAEKVIVENYLSQKYDLSIGANDFFSPGVASLFVNDITGIGTLNGTDKSSTSGFSNALQVSEEGGTLDTSNEFLLMAHDNVAHDQSSTADISDPDITNRWARSWFFDVTGGVSTEFRFDFGEAGLGVPGAASEYVLLYRATTGDDFTRVFANSVSIQNGDQVVVGTNLDLPTGYYTLGRGVQLVNTTYYSFESGNWEDITTWTTDPSGALRVPDAGNLPTSGDNMVILTGRTVTMTTDDNDGVSLTVDGRLDILNTTDHNFFSIAGNGTISIAGDNDDVSNVVDNFPTGSTTDFADPIVGGTVEIIGTGLNLNSNRIYNNVILNLTASSDIATLLANHTLNGALDITNGILQINDNASTTNLNIDVLGDVQVGASGEINVGTANARHQFNFYGDFINNGRAEFTNRTMATVNAEATDGIVDANFLSDDADQSIDCNGVTNFYRIEIDKGADETYILDINALAAANFNLFGFASESHPNIVLVDNANALGLIKGTVRLNANVDIEELNDGGNYNLSEGARLWVNGGSVTTGGNSIVPYGTIRVSDGFVVAPGTAGITTRANGTIIVEGGTVTTNQIRTSVLGADNIGGYFQSGGTVNVTGGSIGTSYYTFSLTYSGNTFNMSGGVLNVSGSQPLNGSGLGGGIFINSDPGNISVTGGTIIMENTTNTNFKVTSKAPFWNVIMRKSGGGTANEVELDAGISGPGGAPETILTPELLVLNDLTIEANVLFDHNGFDVEIGSDFLIDDNAVLDAGGNNKGYVYDLAKPNTTTFNGVDNSIIYVGQSTETGYELELTNMVVNKPADKTVTLTGDPAKEAANVATSFFARLLQITGDFRLESGTLNQGQHAIRLFGTAFISSTGVLAVYQDGVTPTNATIVFRGSGLVVDTEVGAQIGNFNMDTAIPTQEISFTSDVKIIRMGYIDGKINLGENNMTIDFLHDGTSTNRLALNDTGIANSGGEAFYTSGNVSDGGLSLLIAGNTAGTPYDFPIGVSGKHTPASVAVTGFMDDGYITIRPVDEVLGTTDITGGDILSYYWSVDYEDFSAEPTVVYEFTYDAADDDSGNEGTYVAGKVEEATPFLRRFEDDNLLGVPGSVQNEGVNTGTNVITFNGDADAGFTLEAASYTAGVPARFIGAPEIYYTRLVDSDSWYNGFWQDATNWSTVPHDGATDNSARPAAGDFPQAGDIAVIGYGGGTGFALTRHSINIADGNSVDVTKVIYDNPIGNSNRVILRNNANITFDVIEGTGGTFMQRLLSTDVQVINGDFGSFFTNGSFTYSYYLEGGTYNITPPTNTFPNLRIEGGTRTAIFQTDITVNNNFTVDGNTTLRTNNGALGDITVLGDLRVGGYRGGNFIFNNAQARIVEVGGLIFRGNQTFTSNMTVDNSVLNGIEHRLIVNGDISQIYPGDFDLLSGGGLTDNNVVLEFSGEGDHSYTKTDGNTAEFYKLVMNKGNSLSNSFTIDEDFNLQTASTTFTPLELTNGVLRLNNAGIDITVLSGVLELDIPQGTGLQISQGTVHIEGDDSGIILDGSLIIDGATGTLDMDDAVGNGNNFIEYSASGNAVLEVSAGTLNVGSQIRGITSAQTGVLKYRQTGGDVRIGTQAAPENTRGMLQIYNVGSEFTYTGGTLVIERHQDAPSVAALFLDPDDSDLTETIEIFNANTPAGQSDFRINSFIPLENLTINGTNSPTAEIDINALTINQNLVIASGATLNGNALTLTIGGDMDNEGAYDGQLNETIFNSTGTQQITGGGTNNFFQFTKSEIGTLDLTSTLNVADLFTISDGTLSDNGFSVNLAADAVIDGAHSGTGGNGLIFAGGGAQELRRSAAGTGTLGVITVNNPAGLSIPDGNGYNFNIDGGLRLENGVFNVGGSEILLGLNAEIEEVNTFGVSNMMRTNSSFTDGGIGKVFPANYTTDFTFPIGQTFYTPVSFDFGTGGNTFGTTSGTLIVRPANEYHPTVNDGIVNAALGGTGDINNVLQYYWTVQASGVTGMNVDMALEYDQSHVLVAAPAFDETDYIAARILSVANPTFLINKFTNAEVDETTNIITFNFLAADENGITGDYFAGIDEAIPDNVATYTVDTDGGDVGDDVYVETVPGGGAPTGAVVIIPAGLTLSLDQDNIRFYATEIQDGGTLEVDNTTNHRLGELTGTGTLRIVSNGINANLPAFSGDFLSCAGGGLEYAGTGSYSVLGGITTLRNLTLSGSGDLTMANNDITICEDLIINGDAPGLVFNNSNNRRINVTRDLIVTSGTFNAGAGRIDVNGDLNVNGGTYNHGANEITDIAGELTISLGAFDAGTGGQIFLRGDLTLSGGGFNGGSGSSTLRFLGTTTQIVSGDFTGGNGFHRFRMSNFSDGVILNNNIEINNRLILDTGIIETNGNNVTLSSNITVLPTSGSSSSYISGKVLKTLTNIGDDFTFPIGSATLWRPASINSVSAGGLTWEAEYFQASPTTDPLVDNLTATTPSPTIETVSNGEYWKISDDAGAVPPPGVTATVGLSWGVESDVSSVSSEREELEVMIWNDGLTSWDNLGGTTFSGGHTQSEGRFTASSTNTFSEQIFTLGSKDVANALPITLESFTGYAENARHYLEWVTSSEINNDYFELQRSIDGLNYEVLTTVEGAGTTSDRQSYSYIDSSPVFGKNYYRLVQIDIDGQRYDEGDIILLEKSSQLDKLDYKLYPNPTDRFNINLEIGSPDTDRDIIVSLYDLQGRRYYKEVHSADQLNRQLSIEISDQAKSGMYIVIVEQGELVIQKKLLIQ